MASIFRSVLGLPVAAVVTVFLFLLMYGLVRVDQLPEVEESDDININFQRNLTDSEVRNQKVFERPALDQPPPPPPAINQQNFQPQVDGVQAVAPTFEANVDIGSGFNPDRDAQPIVRIPPQLSDFQRCIRSDEQKTERVVLEFDVTPEGQVANVRVVGSTDRCYERAAIRSAQRWKYNPKIVDGSPEPRFGVRTTIEFQVGGEG
ncbi:energy transducer TonB family protein [Parvularcula marina]|uniref:TonB family protein n=1 Tax=Parvularcula marina TaxID=2292771 RepID=A0A371RK53_9PROT|nr:energy transducer TonB [Parvularcula marina]RFB05824.1 TonB family protein [Parvularcula marina]